MYKNKNFLLVIPARAGSKRIPNKNIKMLNKRHLIFYAINAGLKSKYIDRLIVSTDSDEIAKIAEKYGAEAPFKRPKKLAADKASTLSVLQHAVDYLKKKENYEADFVIALQPTSPLVLAGDIDNAIKKIVKENVNSCISLTKINQKLEWMYYKKNNKFPVRLLNAKNKILKKQDLRNVFSLNGAIYITKKEILKKGKIVDDNSLTAIIMPRNRSIDIDEPVDFIMAEALIKQAKYE